ERQEGQEDGRVEDVRRVVAEQPDPAREEERVPGRVAAVEAPVIGDVALHQRVDLRRQPRRERIERRPMVEDPAMQQVVREGEVAELVDGEVPGRVVVHHERGQHEQLGRGGEPEGGEHARQRHDPEQRQADGRRCGPGLRAAPRGARCARRGHAALYPVPARGEKRVGVAARGCYESLVAVAFSSPLKALGNDWQRNLAHPIAEMRALAEAAGAPLPEIRALVRSGDTPASERRAMRRRPPHILVTTPESLYILLTAEGSRRWLAGARTVIVDEIHAVAADKRGAHLALSLE